MNLGNYFLTEFEPCSNIVEEAVLKIANEDSKLRERIKSVFIRVNLRFTHVPFRFFSAFFFLTFLLTCISHRTVFQIQNKIECQDLPHFVTITGKVTEIGSIGQELFDLLLKR